MNSKIFKCLTIALLLSFTYIGNSQNCQNNNGNMETSTAPITSGNSWINNHLTNWKVSHGSPSASASPSNNIWMWSYNGYGEGIYTDFNFVAGQTYSLTYRLWRYQGSNLSSTFLVRLSNSLSPNSSTIVPSTSGTQLVSNQNWTSGGLGTWVTITETFTVTGSGFSQLWLYPLLSGLPSPDQAECRVDDICINQVIINPPHPCELKPEFKISAGKFDCIRNFQNVTNLPGANFQILETTWDFGDGTSGTGESVSHVYTQAGIYKVCMTAWVTDGKECCKIEVCEEVKIEKPCDPCELIQKIEIKYNGTGPIDFEAVGLPIPLMSVYGYYWDFGDGTTGSGQNVLHHYDNDGVYKVCLTVFYYNEKSKKCCSYQICIEVKASGSKPKSAMQTNANNTLVKDKISELTVFSKS